MQFFTALLSTYLCLFYDKVTSVPIQDLTEKVSDIQDKQEQFQTVIEKTGEILAGFLQDAPKDEKVVDFSEAGDEVNFVSSPGLILPQITQSLTLNCSWHIEADKKKDPKIFSVTSIAIEHKDKTIVTYRKGLPVSVVKEDKNLIASGKFDDKIGYLEMTYKSPTDKQSGAYTCLIGGTDKQGSPDTNKKTVDIDLVDYVKLVSRMDELEEENKNLKENLNKTIDKELERRKTVTLRGNTDTISNLTASIANLTSNIFSINTTVNDNMADINNNSANINRLRTKVNTNVMFTAGASSYMSTSKAMIFNKVITNLGGDYNPATGVFTCSVPGTYLFLVHVMGKYDTLVAVHLKHNGNSIVRMLADDKFDLQSGSNSASLKLSVGDTVYVTPDADIYPHNTPYTTFTGLLVAKE